MDFEDNDSFIVKVANNLDEFTELLEKGFTYITDYQDLKVLRKRKYKYLNFFYFVPTKIIV